MDTVLAVVTLLSLTLAAGMAVIVWKQLQAERQRSDARVEALRQMAAAEAGNQFSGARAIDAPPDLVLDTEPEPEFDGRAVGVGSLFEEPERRSPWGRRLAIGAGIGVVLIGSVLLMRDRSGRPSAPPSITVAESQVAVNPAGGTLELISLHHSQEGKTITVTGLVQNPRNGRPLDGVVATVFLFTSDGSMAGSGRAPLDYTHLAPGDESPFLVTLPVATGVSRYRIGFRATDGRVIGHVDRRDPATPVAQRN